MRPPLRIDPKIVSNRRGIGSCILVTKKIQALFKISEEKYGD